MMCETKPHGGSAYKKITDTTINFTVLQLYD